MKFFFIIIALFWLISYVIATVQIAKSKDRISFLSIVLMFLFPFIGVFFTKKLTHIEGVYRQNKKRHHSINTYR